ncbi:unannotated protein [freshwater metagenome]|uniref:Unannotated protein n=1 Tax=freshwater metagenome TaxID=449393 RepID=A0A6J5ZR88_9ZZZZ
MGEPGRIAMGAVSHIGKFFFSISSKTTFELSISTIFASENPRVLPWISLKALGATS